MPVNTTKSQRDILKVVKIIIIKKTTINVFVLSYFVVNLIVKKGNIYCFYLATSTVNNVGRTEDPSLNEEEKKRGFRPAHLQRFHLMLHSVVLRLQVSDPVLGLAQLSLQLGLQLPAPLLELQQLLLSLLAAVGRQGAIRQQVETEGGQPGRNSSAAASEVFIFSLS